MNEAEPYHHGSLRAALIEEGRALLAEEGEGAVSLRELARRTGVSHAAPSRHFKTREVLLDAMAADGFDELTTRLEAAQGPPGDFDARFAAYAHAHVRFAATHGALMALMFARRRDGSDPDSPLHRSAARFFRLGAEMLGERDVDRVGAVPYLFASTLEGVGGLAAAGRIPPDRLDEVVDAAVEMMLPTIRAQLGMDGPADRT